MNRYDIAFLTIRAFALYAWFQALEFFAGGIMNFVLNLTLHLRPRITFVDGISAFVPSLVFFAAGIYLFVRSRQLALHLLPPSSDEAAEQLPPNPLATASVAFAVVGLVIFLYAAPRCVTLGIKVAQSEPDARRPLAGLGPQMIPNALQLVVGFFLFLKSRSFAAAWWRKQQPKGLWTNSAPNDSK